MKWLKKWIFKAVKEGSELDQADQMSFSNQLVAKDSSSTRFEQRGMNFTLYKANGGYVLEYRSYDRKTDRNDNRLHIITGDQDLGQQIAHIITFEALQQ